MQQKNIELSVGFLIVVTFFCLLFIALDASFVKGINKDSGFMVSADFDNVAGLRVKSPVKLSGVRIGEVVNIGINDASYQAHVVMRIDKSRKIPIDSQALVLTEGLLGSKYIGLEPGLSNDYLQNGNMLEKTVPAMVLENLIGKIMLKLTK